MVLLSKIIVFEDRPLGARVPPSSILESKMEPKWSQKPIKNIYKNRGRILEAKNGARIATGIEICRRGRASGGVYKVAESVGGAAGTQQCNFGAVRRSVFKMFVSVGLLHDITWLGKLWSFRTKVFCPATTRRAVLYNVRENALWSAL